MRFQKAAQQFFAAPAVAVQGGVNLRAVARRKDRALQDRWTRAQVRQSGGQIPVGDGDALAQVYGRAGMADSECDKMHRRAAASASSNLLSLLISA